METTSTKAMLIGADDFDARSGAVSTIISREEIEKALSSDEPAVLLLDVVRAAAEGSPRTRETLSVQWDRWDLERLLKVSSGDSVRLSFPHDELERALDEPEVEGHGLRETAAILTVAAAAAVGAASAGASNLEAPSTGGAGGDSAIVAVHDEMTPAARGIETAPAADEAGLTARGIESAAETSSLARELTQASRTEAAPETVVPYMSQGQGVDESQFGGTPPATEPSQVVPYVSQGQGVDESQFSGVGTEPVQVHDEAIAAARQMNVEPAAVHDEATLASRGIETSAVHEEATLASRGITTPAVHDEAGLVARGIVPGAVHDEATLAARGIEAPAPDDGGWTLEAPNVDPGTAAAVGGAAGGAILLITAAGFALRRSHGPRPV